MEKENRMLLDMVGSTIAQIYESLVKEIPFCCNLRFWPYACKLSCCHSIWVMD